MNKLFLVFPQWCFLQSDKLIALKLLNYEVAATEPVVLISFDNVRKWMTDEYCQFFNP